jgi:ATP-dependent 26S proteasome regulatory subunit
VFLAVRDQQHLRTALERLRAEWRRWRRTERLVRTSQGRGVEGAALDWSTLVLEPKLASDVRTTVEAFAKGESLYQSAGIPWRRGMLLHGPPGNGKTMLCRAIFGQLKWPVITVTPSGNDEADDLRSWLDQAHDLSPSIVVFEDLDSLITPRLPLSAFLNTVDGFDARNGVLLIATTNHPEKLDAAISARPSRFDRVFHIAPPEAPERERYLGQLYGARLAPPRVRTLARDTAGFSMAFLKELFLHSVLLSTSRGEVKPTELDLEEAFYAVRSHVKGAKREFTQSRAAGFALAGDEEPPPMAEATAAAADHR